MGILLKDQYKFMIISRILLLTMRNVPNKMCSESKSTHFIFRIFSKSL